MADYNTPEIYEDYLTSFEDTQGEPLSEDLFKHLCEEFNKKIMDKVTYEGRPFEMGSFLSAIQIVRIKRDYSKKVVNWKASNKRKQELLDEGKKLYDDETGEGHKWLVYYTDPFYCRFHWAKKYARVPNKSAYKFVATRGAKGNKTKLKEFLREKKLNYRTYKELKV